MLNKRVIELVLGGTAVLVLTLLSGCRLDRRHDANEQKHQIYAAVNHLREALNGGACQSIFDEAEQGLRRTVSLAEWLSQCSKIRSNLGHWESFDIHSYKKIANNIIDVSGVAMSARSSPQVLTVWHLGRGPAELSALIVKGDGIDVAVPRVSLPNWVGDPPDDPPRRPRRPAVRGS